MIRFVIGLFVFAVALCAYIVNLPDGRGSVRATPVQQADVTRAGTDATAPLPTAIALADFAPTTPDLDFATTSDPLALTLANVLAGLGLDADHLGAIAARASGPQTQLEYAVLQALQARTPDAEIAGQITLMAMDGRVSVPDVLVRADGLVDVQTLLQSVVDQALIAAGEAAPVTDMQTDPALIWSGSQASYVVQAGDSLAALSKRFYGDVTRTDILLVANPAILPSAERIAPGQVLVIPQL
ncbi:LysM peptidoglycan-binding domain-containing protein [Yoonia sp. 208BN28-4]|uniref:LysM peptidoglycan-binding domain-containing protein n=1 Tax=Yoonia sp. 208BN28-4 TaxID=3126505 RepID=UPI00309DE9E7